MTLTDVTVLTCIVILNNYIIIMPAAQTLCYAGFLKKFL